MVLVHDHVDPAAVGQHELVGVVVVVAGLGLLSGIGLEVLRLGQGAGEQGLLGVGVAGGAALVVELADFAEGIDITVPKKGENASFALTSLDEVTCNEF